MNLSDAVAAALADAKAARQNGFAVVPICNAILQHDPTASTFTYAHLLLVELSLESHLYTEALPVLDRHIFYFQSEGRQTKAKSTSQMPTQDILSYKFKYQELLEYFLGAGTIYIGLQQWEKALDMLENAITYPVKDNAVSKIMVDAYKKWVLVKILVEGKPGALPSTTNQNAAKIYHTLAKPYETVASLFQSATAKRLRAEIMAGDEVWADDYNTGLVLLVLASYQKFQIRHLADVYRSLSIEDVTRITESAEPVYREHSNETTDALILNMIASGAIHASMSHPSNSAAILTFRSSSRALPEHDVQVQIAASMTRLKSMANDIKTTDKRLTNDKEYLKWAKNQKKMGNNGTIDAVSSEEMLWHTGEDEDLMGGGF